ncbi:MAG: permease [Armatimonadetes bacterium]|nr:permease [Armatimonadota bacterium]
MSVSGYFQHGSLVADAPLDARVAFMRRTYLHLTAAIVGFLLLSTIFFYAGVGVAILNLMAQFRYGWFLILGGFMLAGWIANTLAANPGSQAKQYTGLSLYTLAEALIFAPMLTLAALMPGVLPTAGGITLLVFGGLTAYTLTTRQDFSFLKSALVVASLVALGLIVAGTVFGFQLGIWFSGAMILLAAGSILYSTSKIVHHYQTDQHVAAALELFAALALLFWYVLRLVMALQRR